MSAAESVKRSFIVVVSAVKYVMFFFLSCIKIRIMRVSCKLSSRQAVILCSPSAFSESSVRYAVPYFEYEAG